MSPHNCLAKMHHRDIVHILVVCDVIVDSCSGWWCGGWADRRKQLQLISISMSPGTAVCFERVRVAESEGQI